MKRLYIDFDGVILDTITYLYRDFKETCKNYTEEEIKNFYVNYHWENIIKDDFVNLIYQANEKNCLSYCAFIIVCNFRRNGLLFQSKILKQKSYC